MTLRNPPRKTCFNMCFLDGAGQGEWPLAGLCGARSCVHTHTETRKKATAKQGQVEKLSRARKNYLATMYRDEI